MNIIRTCSNCTHWTPLLQDDPQAGACAIKQKITSRLAICGAFESKIAVLPVVRVERW